MRTQRADLQQELQKDIENKGKSENLAGRALVARPAGDAQIEVTEQPSCASSGQWWVRRNEKNVRPGFGSCQDQLYDNPV